VGGLRQYIKFSFSSLVLLPPFLFPIPSYIPVDELGHVALGHTVAPVTASSSSSTTSSSAGRAATLNGWRWWSDGATLGFLGCCGGGGVVGEGLGKGCGRREVRYYLGGLPVVIYGVEAKRYLCIASSSSCTSSTSVPIIRLIVHVQGTTTRMMKRGRGG
jgi:hypothetical protein